MLEFCEDFLFSASFIVCHGRFLRGRILHARPMPYLRACIGLVHITLHYRRTNFLPLLTLLRINDVIDVARFISIFIILFYVDVHICTNSIISK